ncbi:hypothetical protein FPZ42_07725 [Mucilaginibacter achroorhodeus]|uniref:Uncharacterized protein n=1 Tax=Mucilaginibacter achroorhodeus TaxID=2599294 RepID=A0A563U6E9_9SPHI|nr:hypothetical protein [Mucilaginibacter achroorhodeus]TWR26915.1 hypothetical protein FPZ42_07725 [Mucilaginibacter achroorhodeus]
MDKAKLTKAVQFIADTETPLERWLDKIDEPSKVELDIFSLVYGWIVIKDNDIVELTKENVDFYLSEFIRLVPNADDLLHIDVLQYVFTDRFQIYQNELAKIRASQLSDNVYLSNYFYQRVYVEPLALDDLPETVKYNSDDWQDYELADMFIHQTNHLYDYFSKL